MARKPKKQTKVKKAKTSRLTLKNKAKLAVDKQNVPRHREKYAALNFKRQVKTRLDALETDYVDKLSDADKAWLNAFLEETVITNFQHKGKKFYKTKQSKREFYSSNNARNRCMFTKAKAMGTIVNTESDRALSNMLDREYSEALQPGDYENAIIEAITIKNQLKDET